MSPGRIRLDLFGSFGTGLSDVLVSCPDAGEALCGTEGPDYLYTQELAWQRLSPSLTFGLGKGWQVGVNIPLDHRGVEIRSTTLDGDAYVPPNEDTDRWSGSRVGLADMRLLVSWFGTVGERWVVGGGLGSTLPTGTSDPYPIGPAVDGLARRPMILGSGTFQPLALVNVILKGERWGAYLGGNLLLPLYPNGDGYRSPRSVEIDLGPTFRLTPPLQVVAALVWGWEGPGIYDGVPLGGQTQVSGSMTVIHALSARLTFQAEARLRMAERLLDDTAIEGTTPRAALAMGITWIFARPE